MEKLATLSEGETTSDKIQMTLIEVVAAAFFVFERPFFLVKLSLWEVGRTE
jgi:hypothetical protein